MAFLLTMQHYCAIIVTNINRAMTVKEVLRMKTVIMKANQKSKAYNIRRLII